MQPAIYTHRLVLTRVEKLDLGFLSYCLSSEEAHGAFLSTAAVEPEVVKERFRSGAYWNDDSKTFIVKLKEDQTRLGLFHFWTKADDRSTVRYTIQIAATDHRNLGYGTEAQHAAINALFRQTSIENVEVYTDMNNAAEVRSLEKLGFRYCESKPYFDVDIERTGNLYRLTRAEFLQAESLRQ